jgi:hypothetical protein
MDKTRIWLVDFGTASIKDGAALLRSLFAGLNGSSMAVELTYLLLGLPSCRAVLSQDGTVVRTVMLVVPWGWGVRLAAQPEMRNAVLEDNLEDILEEGQCALKQSSRSDVRPSRSFIMRVWQGTGQEACELRLATVLELICVMCVISS